MTPQKNKAEEWIGHCIKSLEDSGFLKVTLGHYNGVEPGLKNIYIKPVLIRQKPKLSLTYRYQTRDIVKNIDVAECASLLRECLQQGFRSAHLFTNAVIWQLETRKNGNIHLSQQKSSVSESPEMQHDRTKVRFIMPESSAYLYHLGISNAEGVILKHGQDKYKQINHYIEILRPLLTKLPVNEQLKVADMGSGKGYLTFALYDFLVNHLQFKVTFTGVEEREDLVTLCNRVSEQNQYDGLHFEQGSIASYQSDKTDILIALHACDTATDEAIYKGITSNAGLIVVAPCCHKQIRKELEATKKVNELDFITRHGIYLEREAEMITDSIRGLILEANGYKVKIMEFISSVHTPKNTMIIASKNSQLSGDREVAMKRIQDAKEYFGIREHHLGHLLSKNGKD